MRQARRRGKAAGSELVVPEKRIERSQRKPRHTGGPIDGVCKFLKGGRATFMEMAQLASQIEPGLACIVESYEKLTPPARRSVDLDALCKLNEIEPAHFLGVVAEAAQKFSSNSSILIAALNMPSVVQKSIRVAMTTEGDKDRKMLFQHSNFIPTPGGISITNVAKANAQAASNSAVERGMPSFEADVLDAEQ